MDKGLNVLSTSYKAYQVSSSNKSYRLDYADKGEKTFKSVFKERSDSVGSDVRGRTKLPRKNENDSPRLKKFEKREEVALNHNDETLSRDVVENDSFRKEGQERAVDKSPFQKGDDLEKTAAEKLQSETEKSAQIFFNLEELKENLTEFMKLLNALFNEEEINGESAVSLEALFKNIDAEDISSISLNNLGISSELVEQLNSLLSKQLADMDDMLKLIGDNPKQLDDISRERLEELLAMMEKGSSGFPAELTRMKDLKDKINALLKELNGETLEVNKTVSSIVKSEGEVNPLNVKDDLLSAKEANSNLEEAVLTNSESKAKSKADRDLTSVKVVDTSKLPEGKEVLGELSREFETEFVAKTTEVTTKQNQIRQNMRVNIFEQLSAQIAKKPMKVGESSEMIIRLKPEELGKVELKIEVHKDVVVAKMNVESQMVKEAIEASLSDLKSSLKDKGFTDMTFNVDVSKGGDQSEKNPKARSKSKIAIEKEDDLEMMIYQYNKSLESAVHGSSFEHLA